MTAFSDETGELLAETKRIIACGVTDFPVYQAIALLEKFEAALSASPVGRAVAPDLPAFLEYAHNEIQEYLCPSDDRESMEVSPPDLRELASQLLEKASDLRAAPVAQEPVADTTRARMHADRIRWLLKNDPDGLAFALEMHREARSIMETLDELIANPPATLEGVILETLREHHNWHLQSGTIGLQDGDGGWIEIDNGAEYSDSALYERTAKLLEGAPPEELQPMPRGGMNTWWWEQAVLLRRKVRALEKAATATSAGVEEDWRDDPSADERWQAGLDYGMERFCSMLGVDPKDVRWDAATEELDGDVCAVIGNILRVKFGDDFDPMKPLPPAGVGADEIARVIDDAINKYGSLMFIQEHGWSGFCAKVREHALALLSRAGDQSNSTQKDGSR